MCTFQQVAPNTIVVQYKLIEMHTAFVSMEEPNHRLLLPIAHDPVRPKSVHGKNKVIVPYILKKASAAVLTSVDYTTL